MSKIFNKFESSVISYSSQAGDLTGIKKMGFESSVISYSSQARCISTPITTPFESSVISYSSQALLPRS